MIDLHSAISLCQKWKNELDKSKFHFTIASTLFETISWTGTPPVLLLRAGRALNLNIPGIISWHQLDKILDIHSLLGSSRMHRYLWPNILTTPMNPCDSGAFIWQIETDSDYLKIKSVDEVQKSWWYELFNTASEATADIVFHICEMCGSEASRKCAACKKVYYCCQDCQKADWLVLHKKICGQISKH